MMNMTALWVRLTLAASISLTVIATAQASGPDQFVVSGVSKGDVLNIRQAPSANSPIIGSLRNGDVINNRGCRQVQTSRWCNISHRGGSGWVSGRYISEYVPGATTPVRPGKPLPLGDTAETSLDWDGTYSGILPCRGCKGIKTILTLKQNRTYILREIRIGNSGQTYQASGRMKFDPTHRSVIRLDAEANFRGFFVGEGFMEEVDFSSGKPVRLGKRHRLQMN